MSAERRHSANATHSRGVWRPDLLARSPRHLAGLARMLLRAVASETVAARSPYAETVPLPGLAQRWMRIVLLMRGLYDDNTLGTAGLERAAEGVLQPLRRPAPAREPRPGSPVR